MRVAVTGSNGFVGQALVQQLADRLPSAGLCAMDGHLNWCRRCNSLLRLAFGASCS